jgi:hypothetical protein
MSVRYGSSKDGWTILDGRREMAKVSSGELSDSAKIVRALNERDASEHVDVLTTDVDATFLRSELDRIRTQEAELRAALIARAKVWRREGIIPSAADELERILHEHSV